MTVCCAAAIDVRKQLTSSKSTSLTRMSVAGADSVASWILTTQGCRQLSEGRVVLLDDPGWDPLQVRDVGGARIVQRIFALCQLRLEAVVTPGAVRQRPEHALELVLRGVAHAVEHHVEEGSGPTHEAPAPRFRVRDRGRPLSGADGYHEQVLGVRAATLGLDVRAQRRVVGEDAPVDQRIVPACCVEIVPT